jgi:hypothetical protein
MVETAAPDDDAAHMRGVGITLEILHMRNSSNARSVLQKRTTQPRTAAARNDDAWRAQHMWYGALPALRQTVLAVCVR